MVRMYRPTVLASAAYRIKYAKNFRFLLVFDL